MFDHDHGIAAVRQSLQDIRQFVYVREMKSCRGFVQYVHRPSSTSSRQLGGKLDPLRLAARELGGRLAQLDVAKSHVIEGLDLRADRRHMLEELQCLLDRHVQDLVDVLPFVAHLQSLPVVSVSVAYFAGDIDVRKEIHFNLDVAVAGARLAAAALHIEGEPSLLVASGFRIVGACKQIPDLVKDSRIGRGIGARRASDRALVDADDLVQLAVPIHRLVLPHDLMSTVQFICQSLVEDLIDQGALAGARHSRHAGEDSQREPDVDVLQVILRSTADRQPAGGRPAALRHRDLHSPRQVGSRYGLLAVLNILSGSRAHDPSSVLSGTGADVDQEVRRSHGVLVMLHDDHGIAQISEMVQRVEQLVVVPLVKADGRLVQDIGNAHQAGADLCRQADPLRFSAGQRSRGAGKGQIVQSDVIEK